MYDSPHRQPSGHQQLAQTPAAGGVPTTPAIQTSVAVDYWVIDETGQLADPGRTAGLPGTAATESPYTVRVETPSCGSCCELQETFESRARSAVTAAHDRGCRLLALGVRPDLLTGKGHPADQPVGAATAGSRISFTVEPELAVDCYNVLLALDSAFVLLNTTSQEEAVCGRPAWTRRPQAVAPYRTDASESGAPKAAFESQSVELLDGSRIEWHSLDPAMPTLLVDLIADIKTVLTQAVDCRLSVDSFGDGFRGDRLVLPDEQWRGIYTQEAVEKGLSSLLVRELLERFGIDTRWYRTSRPPPVDDGSSTDCRAICRQRAALLEADVGVSQLISK